MIIITFWYYLVSQNLHEVLSRDPVVDVMRQTLMVDLLENNNSPLSSFYVERLVA